jgi:hypothetical protein
MVPLKNWATPLYWQPNPAAREVVGKAQPQFQFSANQVSADALTFIAITPCRLVDTRGVAAGFNGLSPFSGPSIAAATTVTFPVQSATEALYNTLPAPCGMIPSIAEAYSFNLTVVPHVAGAVDYVSLWPSGGTQPFVSTLNDPQGEIVANAAIVPAGTPSGGISVYNAGPATTDVVIDMNGYFAAPTDGSDLNTAIGTGALQNNTTGNNNTAIGYQALRLDTTGNFNTASGVAALSVNTTGVGNTASGVYALEGNTTGSDNTATGFWALGSNSSGDYNTAIGYNALVDNNSGGGNTAIGEGALRSNTTGGGNTASGANALYSNTTASNNIAIGNGAASSVSGSNGNNIHIGSVGAPGDSNTIRVGTQGTQTSTYIAGISGATPGTPNLLICVDGNGQLGTTGCIGPTSAAVLNDVQKQAEQIHSLEDRLAALETLLFTQVSARPAGSLGNDTAQYRARNLP